MGQKGEKEGKETDGDWALKHLFFSLSFCSFSSQICTNNTVAGVHTLHYSRRQLLRGWAVSHPWNPWPELWKYRSFSGPEAQTYFGLIAYQQRNLVWVT